MADQLPERLEHLESEVAALRQANTIYRSDLAVRDEHYMHAANMLTAGFRAIAAQSEALHRALGDESADQLAMADAYLVATSAELMAIVDAYEVMFADASAVSP